MSYHWKNPVNLYKLTQTFDLETEDEPLATIINQLPDELDSESQSHDLGMMMKSLPQITCAEDALSYADVLSLFKRAMYKTAWSMLEAGLTRDEVDPELLEVPLTPSKKSQNSKIRLTMGTDFFKIPEYQQSETIILNRDQADLLVECLDAYEKDWGGDIGDFIRLPLENVAIYLRESGVFGQGWEATAFLLASLYPEKYWFSKQKD